MIDQSTPSRFSTAASPPLTTRTASTEGTSNPSAKVSVVRTRGVAPGRLGMVAHASRTDARATEMARTTVEVRTPEDTGDNAEVASPVPLTCFAGQCGG